MGRIKRAAAVWLGLAILALCGACGGTPPNYFVVSGAGENGVALVDSLTGEHLVDAFDGFLFPIEGPATSATVSVGLMEEKTPPQIRLLQTDRTQVKRAYIEQHIVPEELSMETFRICKGGLLYSIDEKSVLARMEADVGPLRYSYRVGDKYAIILGVTVGLVKAEHMLWGAQ